VLGEQQLPERFRNIIDEEQRIFERPRRISPARKIPDTTSIPLDDPTAWVKVPDVICVFIDMMNSTKLSADTAEHAVAGAYRLFTGTVVRLLDEFDAPYIDVRGDGAFALFNRDQTHRALAAAVTAKTFIDEEFVPSVRNHLDADVGSHIGIDQRLLYVRKIGFRRYGGRTDRQNEVWAGRTVNMAAKLASKSLHNQVLVSERFYRNLSNEKPLKSCGCESGRYTGNKTDLWTKVDLSEDKRFDFKTAYLLRSSWCRNHGREFCESMLRADS